MLFPFHELWHLSGADNGHWYPLWSGPGSDLGELAIIGGMITVVRAHQCHVDRCWRLGKHPVGDGTLKVCRLHHPGVPSKVTAEHVAQRHNGVRRQHYPR